MTIEMGSFPEIFTYASTESTTTLAFNAKKIKDSIYLMTLLHISIIIQTGFILKNLIPVVKLVNQRLKIRKEMIKRA